jgi:hypothetical protein
LRDALFARPDQSIAPLLHSPSASQAHMQLPCRLDLGDPPASVIARHPRATARRVQNHQLRRGGLLQEKACSALTGVDQRRVSQTSDGNRLRSQLHRRRATIRSVVVCAGRHSAIHCGYDARERSRWVHPHVTSRESAAIRARLQRTRRRVPRISDQARSTNGWHFSGDPLRFLRARERPRAGVRA